jgi:hypothetical protein
MKLGLHNDVYRQRLAKIRRKQRKEKLEFKRSRAGVNRFPSFVISG